METFTLPRPFVHNPTYPQGRERALATLDLREIDPPLVGLVQDLVRLPECYTLQSCYGHFLWAPGHDSHTLDRLPQRDPGPITYRIAYVAFCLDESEQGRALYADLARVPETAPRDVQFGSADWFWARCLNSYALQVMPARNQDRDWAVIDHAEALRVEAARGRFFDALGEIVAARLDCARP